MLMRIYSVIASLLILTPIIALAICLLGCSTTEYPPTAAPSFSQPTEGEAFSVLPAWKGN